MDNYESENDYDYDENKEVVVVKTVLVKLYVCPTLRHNRPE